MKRTWEILLVRLTPSCMGCFDCRSSEGFNEKVAITGRDFSIWCDYFYG